MKVHPNTCRGCPLDTLGVGFATSVGVAKHGVVLVGEALGKEEAERGEPFVGASGRILQEAFGWAGVKRGEFLITNTVWCRPPENKLEGQPYEEGAVAQCVRQHLTPLLGATNPKVLLLLGGVATRAILKLSNILSVRGYPYRVKVGRWEGWVVPTVHPAFIQRGQTRWLQVLVHDIQKALAVAKGGFTPASTASYLLDPGVGEAERWMEGVLADPSLPLAVDIETPRRGEDEEDEDEVEALPILRIGFAKREGEALSIPHSKEYHPLIERVLRGENPKLIHNARFDVPHLEAAGYQVGGAIHDTMLAWHVLHSDLPKGLGFVATMLLEDQPPWKGLSRERPAFYNATDVDVTWRIWPRIVRWLRETDLWGVYERHVLRIDPIFARMSKAGMPIDGGARREAAERLWGMLEGITQDLQQVVPLEVYPYHPKGGYKKKGPGVGEEEGWVKLPNGLWAKRLPFVPSAGVNGGLRRYQGAMKHRPISRKGKETTDEVALQQLCLRYPEDPLYPLILRRREVEKLSSTYVGRPEGGGTVGGIKVGRDGRAHPVLTHNPSTLRTSCVSPNLQQIPRATGLGRVVKEMFRAPAGWLLGEADFSAIEAVLVGYFAQSPRYMRIAKLGIHDFVNAHALVEEGKLPASSLPSLEWEDEALRAYLQDLKHRFPAERDVRKRLVHGHNYLMGPKLAQDVLLKELGRTIPLKDVRKLFSLYDELFPEIGEWQRELCRVVGGLCILPAGRPYQAGDGWVRNPFGYLHRYNRAIRWERIGEGWEWKFGEDAKRLVAFLPQSTAAGIIKEAILRGAEDPLLLSSLRVLVHDSLVVEAREEVMGEVMGKLVEVMEAPIEVLGGLVIGVERKIGRSWAMEGV